MRIGLGLLTFQRHPDDPRSWQDIYRDGLELAVQAEELGFDSIWTSEHHFVDDGYAPSLPVISAANAARTSEITIGTAVLLAPLYHPLRLAEDAATVSLLSQGRFVLGLGAGWRDEEFELLESQLTQRAARLRETVKTLRSAWSGQPFEFRGKNVRVTPDPEGHVPIWIGGFADGAIKRAGRIADGFLGSSSGTAGIDAFKRARELTGRVGDPAFTFALHVPVFCWPDEFAWDVVKPWYHALRWKYADMSRSRAPSGLASPPPLDPDTEAALRPTIICGTPDECAAGIAEYRSALGDDIHFICRSVFPGMPADLQSESVRLLGERVLGALR